MSDDFSADRVAVAESFLANAKSVASRTGFSELQHDAGRDAAVTVVGEIAKMSADPIHLDNAKSESLAEANVQTSTHQHRKATDGLSTTRKRSSAEQGMHEGLHHRQASG